MLGPPEEVVNVQEQRGAATEAAPAEPELHTVQKDEVTALVEISQPKTLQTRGLTIFLFGALGIQRQSDVVSKGCYCSCSIGRLKFYSPVAQGDDHALWNYEVELRGTVVGDPFEFAIWDKPEGCPDHLLGRASLPPDEFGTNGWNGALHMQGEGLGPDAYLRFQIKLEGQEYPLLHVPEVIVSIERHPEGRSLLGLELDMIGAHSAHIVFVGEEGLVAQHNEAAAHADQVYAGDYLVSVNESQFGVSPTEDLLRILQRDQKLELVLRRPEEFPVFLTRWQNGTLGMHLNYSPNGVSLLICEVGDGPVNDWNFLHPDRQIRAQDRIVAVEGVRGTAQQLYEKLRASEAVNLIVSRPADINGCRWLL